VKDNPKFTANPDPYPTGSKHGAKKSKAKEKIIDMNEPITDLNEDHVELLAEDPVGRPIGNKRALKAKRQKDSGGLPLSEKLHTMMMKMEEMKKEKDEEMHARQQARERKVELKEAATKARLSASKAQEEYFTQLKEMEREAREDKILFTPVEGLDERSKEHLLARKNAIYERRRCLQ